MPAQVYLSRLESVEEVMNCRICEVETVEELCKDCSDEISEQDTLDREFQASLNQGKCTECDGDVEYIADWDNHKVGQCWECIECGKLFTKSANRWY